MTSMDHYEAELLQKATVADKNSKELWEKAYMTIDDSFSKLILETEKELTRREWFGSLIDINVTKSKLHVLKNKHEVGPYFDEARSVSNQAKELHRQYLLYKNRTIH